MTVAVDELEHLDDAEVYRQLEAARRAMSADLLRDPVTLARGLDRTFRMRPHLKVIGQALAEVGRGEYDRLLVLTPPQVGKPVYDQSVILMGDGSRKPIEDVRVGDFVITHEGRPRRVTAVHVQGQLPTVQVTTHAGRQTVAALDHPFLTPEGWVNAGDLKPGMSLATVPRPATDGASGLWPEAARLMGYFVGDGNTSLVGRADKNSTTFNCTITTASDGVAKEVRRCADALGFTVNLSQAKKYTQGKVRRLNVSGGVRQWLEEHGLARKNSYTKRVPEAVFQSTPDVIAEFIAGYWDCDGVVSSRGKDRAGQPRKDVHVELYSVSRELLQDVQHLLLRLGIRSMIRLKKGTYNDAEHVSYRLAIIARDDVAKFRELVTLTHEKRAETFAAHTLPRTEFDLRLMADPIVSVEPYGEQPCRCLTVEDDHTFTSDDLVVHNSTTVAEWFPFWWLCTYPMDRVAVTSYGDDLALRRGKKIRSYVEEYGDEWELHLRAGSGAMQDWEVTKAGGVRSVSVGKGLTGHPVNLLIIDDPHKDRADAESEASRRALHDWYSSAALSRLQPDRSAVVAIQTRWHPDDFAGRRIQEEGRIEDGGRWKVIHLPAVADPKFGPDPLGREHGEPLPHPKIPSRDVRRLRAWWANKKATSIVRDWHALYQGDPQPAEGALVSEELLRLLRDSTTPVDPQKIAVAIDPSGGGRDVAGVIGGFLGDDGRVWITGDVSAAMSSAEWSTAACRLAHRTDAAIIYVEWNFGRDMCVLAIQTSWEKLQNDGEIPKGKLMPAIAPVRAKQGKLLRAEPIAQQMVQDKVRFRGVFTDMEREWSTWQSTDPDSPGRIDASCILVYGLIPEANQGAIVHAPLPAAPQTDQFSRGRPTSRATSAYGRKIGR